jgi:hypothetical protein
MDGSIDGLLGLTFHYLAGSRFYLIGYPGYRSQGFRLTPQIFEVFLNISMAVGLLQP